MSCCRRLQRGRKKILDLLKAGILLLVFLLRISVIHAKVAREKGKILYEARCAMCHGIDARGTGPLAQTSTPPANDLTSPAFKKRLMEYPGVIVASVVLMPNGTLIPDTLKKDGIKMAPKDWTSSELRALNQYLVELIKKEK